MKLNAWGKLIQAIGDLPADNDVPRKPSLPKPAIDRAQHARTRAVNAEHRAQLMRKRAEKLQAHLDNDTPFDHGEINISMARRYKALEADITRASQLQEALELAEHHEARARHWRAIEQENTP